MNSRMVVLMFTFLLLDESTLAVCDLYWDVDRHWYGSKDDCARKKGSYNFIHNLETWKQLNHGGNSIDHIYRSDSTGNLADLCPGNNYTLLNSTSTGCLNVYSNRSVAICNNDTVLCYKGTEPHNTASDVWTTTGSMTTPYDVTSTQKSNSTSCSCGDKKNWSTQLGHDELQNLIQELKSQVAVDRKDLSAWKRKSVSVYDSRPSNVAIGCVAIAFLTTAATLIIVPDIISLVRFLHNRY
ncbi:uncharacterized protein LOC110453859 [Mizuhopecten yessoensis]|uniref:Uncharacterized protein n=1 Tax=Mizuhopecten yessoensis TaxID=6573 RepID=A0A210QGL8_MIZYE|nr:uncharacterized protein LOC110453859 [Mizuhopecten yessoensis]OWF47867.1 hypothetical protein KP79_PYT22822 [Mizuhopecten yessoensis]